MNEMENRYFRRNSMFSPQILMLANEYICLANRAGCLQKYNDKKQFLDCIILKAAGRKQELVNNRTPITN